MFKISYFSIDKWYMVHRFEDNLIYGSLTSAFLFDKLNADLMVFRLLRQFNYKNVKIEKA